jgi:hypothetical protein
MKKIMSFILVLVLLTFSSCSTNKEVISYMSFGETLEGMGYTIVDATSQFPEGSVNGVLLAILDTYQIEFYEVPTEEQAIKAFEENKETFDAISSTTSSDSSISLGNYSTYSRTTEDNFYLVTRVENTFIYASVAKEFKEDIEAVVEKLGY